jgi:serine/threonine protein kinase
LPVVPPLFVKLKRQQGASTSHLNLLPLSASVAACLQQSFSEIVGTPFYMAPEVIERCYSFPADIWSVGVVIYLMVAGRLPFTGSTDRQIIKAVMDSQPDFEEGVWNSVSADCRHFLKQMLVKQPAARATLQELLQHPWLSSRPSSTSNETTGPVSSDRKAAGSCAPTHGAANLHCSSRLPSAPDASCCSTYALPPGTGRF